MGWGLACQTAQIQMITVTTILFYIYSCKTNQKLLEGLNCLLKFPIATCVATPVTSGGFVELNTNHVKLHLTCITKDPSFIYFMYYLAISLLTYSTSC